MGKEYSHNAGKAYKALLCSSQEIALFHVTYKKNLIFTLAV